MFGAYGHAQGSKLKTQDSVQGSKLKTQQDYSGGGSWSSGATFCVILGANLKTSIFKAATPGGTIHVWYTFQKNIILT